jgi:hypothetical protein
VAFKVESIREVARIKREAYYRTPLKRKGGRLIRVEVTFVNQTKQPIDPFCGSLNASLADTGGIRHDPIRGLHEIAGNDSVCSNKTPPGDKARATLAFRLERDEEIKFLDMWNGQFRPDFDGKSSRVRFRP